MKNGKHSGMLALLVRNEATGGLHGESALGLDRRQLLTSVAVIAATGIVSNYAQVEAANPAELDGAAEIPDWNVCAATARKIAEITKRNRIREEAKLPLLSISKELRRMKTAEEEAEFEAFAAIHRRAVWDDVLAPERTTELATIELHGGVGISIAGQQNPS